jgi:hypothetical protein
MIPLAVEKSLLPSKFTLERILIKTDILLKIQLFSSRLRRLEQSERPVIRQTRHLVKVHFIDKFDYI